MKFAAQRTAAKREAVAVATELPALELPVVAHTLVFETRGPQARCRLIHADGTETATAWRARDHGMYGEAKLLHTRWIREGLLGGFGRIPRSAQRMR